MKFFQKIFLGHNITMIFEIHSKPQWTLHKENFIPHSFLNNNSFGFQLSTRWTKNPSQQKNPLCSRNNQQHAAAQDKRTEGTEHKHKQIDPYSSRKRLKFSLKLKSPNLTEVMRFYLLFSSISTVLCSYLVTELVFVKNFCCWSFFFRSRVYMNCFQNFECKFV